MARPPKRGLSYSTWDVNVLETDHTMDKLIDAQGPAGFYLYFALCQRAYATEGYFYRWEYDDAATTARKLGGNLSSDQVRCIVNSCFKLGLWSKTLFERHGVLTSKAIQTRFLEGIARRTGPIEIVEEYWLLEKKQAAGLVFVCKKSVYAYKNPGLCSQESSYCTVNEIKLNEMNPHIISPQNSGTHDVEKSAVDGRQKRIEGCTKLLALVQSLTGISYQGDNAVRRMVYGLFDRGYTERDVRAVIMMMDHRTKQAGDAFPAPQVVFGSVFDSLICTPRDHDLLHPEWVRDHYAAQPPARKGGKREYEFAKVL